MNQEEKSKFCTEAKLEKHEEARLIRIKKKEMNLVQRPNLRNMKKLDSFESRNGKFGTEAKFKKLEKYRFLNKEERRGGCHYRLTQMHHLNPPSTLFFSCSYQICNNLQNKL